MARIPPVNESTADAATKRALARVREAWGAPWNIAAGLANNPGVLEAFLELTRSLERSGLTVPEREVVCMEMARANGCHYCVPAHRHVARLNGVDEDMIEAVARGESLAGEGPEAVTQRLVRRLVATGGKLEDEEFRGFQDLGMTPDRMIAVVAEIAHCTLTNTFNRLAGTDLDDFLEPYRV